VPPNPLRSMELLQLCASRWQASYDLQLFNAGRLHLQVSGDWSRQCFRRRPANAEKLQQAQVLNAAGVAGQQYPAGFRQPGPSPGLGTANEA